MVNGVLHDFCCSFKFSNKKHFICTLKGITEITLNLDELNNSINLKDGRPSNKLLTYHVTDDRDFTRFEPQPPQYKNLKMENLLP